MISCATTFRLFSALVATFLLLAGNIVAQEADSVRKGVYILKGKVTDATTGKGVPLANIRILQNWKQIGEDSTDFEGNFLIEPLPDLPGMAVVDVEIICARHNKRKYTDVILHPNFIKTLNASVDKSVLIRCGCGSHHIYAPELKPIQLDEPGTRTFYGESFRNGLR